MPLTLGRTASFGVQDQARYRPNGAFVQVSQVSASSFTFTFDEICPNSRSVAAGTNGPFAAKVVVGEDGVEVIGIPSDSANRSLLINVSGVSGGNVTITSVTAQVTLPVAGDVVSLTEAVKSASSTAPCGIFVGTLPPVATDNSEETIEIVVTFSGACTKGCAAGMLVMPWMNSLTPIDTSSATGTASTISMSLDVLPWSIVLTAVSCDAGILELYAESGAANLTVPNREPIGTPRRDTHYGTVYRQLLDLRGAGVGFFAPVTVADSGVATATLTMTPQVFDTTGPVEGDYAFTYYGVGSANQNNFVAASFY